MTFGQRLRSRFWKTPVENEVDDELAFHVEMRTRELVDGGMSPADARDNAIRRFGDIDRVNNICRAIGRQRNTEMHRTEYLSELRQDLTFACRQLLINPGFTFVAVLTLALGIGATTAIFSAVESVVLRPLPFPDPERIFAVYENFHDSPGHVSAGNFVDGVEPVGAFSAVTAVDYFNFNLIDAGEPARVVGARASAGFFDVFPMAPALGRVYTRDEDQPGRDAVVVLSHRLWVRMFGANPSVVGRTIRLNDRPYEVIGVMPAAFDYTAQSEDLWVPIAFTAERKTMHDEHYLQLYARMKPNVTRADAFAELQRNAERLRAAFPRDNATLNYMLVPALEDLVGDYPKRLLTLLGAVVFVLLIACGNIANLLLARGAARASELAIRAALGAGRARIARQLLTESVVLAFVGGVAGLALAAWGVQALIAAAPPGVPRLEQASMNPLVVGFALLLALVCAVIFGLAPAWRAANANVQAVLKEGGRGSGMGGVRDRLRTGLIVAELAVALLLLVGAGLLIRSAIALQHVNPGFDPSGVLAARLALPAASYADPAKVVTTLHEIVDSVARVPGAEAVGITTQVPMGPGGNGNGLVPEGKAIEPANFISSRLRMVTPGYLTTMRIPILKGRDLAPGDRRGALKVMVISEALANVAFPGQDPIGKRISCCEPGPDGKSPDYKTVVGVAGDVRSQNLATAPVPEFYLPIDQVPAAAWDWIQRTAYVVVRTPLDPQAMTNPLRTVIHDIAPGVPLFQTMTMRQRLRDSLATARFNTLLLALLGAIGLVLAAVGIYGVIAYFVTRRTQEIGIRMALGATRRDVLGLVFRQVAGPIGMGIATGLVLSALLTSVLSTQLYGVSAFDPMTFIVVIGILTIVGFLATIVPARRAASVEPTRALSGQ
jgi:putative ABC transport system permease protein